MVFVIICFASVYKMSHKKIATSEYLSHIKNSERIIGIDAELYGEKTRLGYPNTARFPVADRYNKSICELFGGKTYDWHIYNEKSVRKAQLGSVYFRFSNLEYVKIDFFTAGKGVLGYYVDDNYFVAETGDTDGGWVLLSILNEAYKSNKTAGGPGS